MAETFMVRRYTAWLRDWDAQLCDECVKVRGKVTEQARNGDPTEFEDHDDGTRYYWIEDKDGRFDSEDTCDECGESRDTAGRRWCLRWYPEDGSEDEVIEEEIETEEEAQYLMGEYALAYGGTIEIEEEN